MYPGPNLNILIGPNGTGKSTIVAAIILGLGGNPKVVGRGSKVSEYVKHNCEEATIHIYLQGEQENNHIKVTRQFSIQDKTIWALNNQKCNMKDIMDCIKQYNIQVNNLCQFLPQDRVQDFAKLNQQDLLKETQIAVCQEDLIQKQQELIESRTNQKNFSNAMEKSSERLQEARDANVRLEGKVQNFNKKKKFMESISHIERKLAWLAFDEIYLRLNETKADMEKATQVFQKYKNAAQPADKEIREMKKIVADLQHKNSNVVNFFVYFIPLPTKTHFSGGKIIKF